ncbi:ABC transporter ATP-binding protein [Pseudalkalibacillus sp. SCS-8]|uniref:ABC transporter ATP-binding protein n=1 Tax=Pseudalkalibacillus nanhaiensis TaxID=3115291 RepID=UPI0032DA1219
MMDILNKLKTLFNKKEKNKMILLFIMMIIAASVETLGIGLIVPFVNIITKPDFIKENVVLDNIYTLFGFQTYTSFVIFSVVCLLMVYVLKNVYLYFFNHIQFKFILNQEVVLSRKLLSQYLRKPYVFHIEQNSANLNRNINSEVSKVFQGIIIAGFQLITEVLVVICILGLLLFVAPLATATTVLIMGSTVFIFFISFKKKMNMMGKQYQGVSGLVIKWINQALGALKEIKVNGKETFFLEAYTKHSQLKADTTKYKKIMEQVPRLVIESILVFTVLLTMLITFFQYSDTSQMVTTMALFAMAAFRLMPSITRILALLTTVRYNQPALDVVYEDLLSMKGDSTASEDNIKDVKAWNEKFFTNEIRLSGICFRYPNQQQLALKDLSLSIPIGGSVAIIGPSGSGKSTLLDVMLGLLEPESGSVIIDGKKLRSQEKLWKKKIGYIPQSIYLTDDTIRNNIAFGISKERIDDHKIWRVLEQAQLKDFVAGLPGKLNATIGERGVKLSGGQRQRIGIARALYHDPEILFMDEATSALDDSTEKEIMRAIDGLKGDKTLIIIAHRLSTIENCDLVFNINDGKLVSTTKKVNMISS